MVQSGSLDAGDSALVALFTNALTDAPLYRLTVASAPANGLDCVSQGMVDKILATRRAKCGPVIGRLSAADMLVLNTMLSVMIGRAD